MLTQASALMDTKKKESSGNYVDSLANMIIGLGKIEFKGITSTD